MILCATAENSQSRFHHVHYSEFRACICYMHVSLIDFAHCVVLIMSC